MILYLIFIGFSCISGSLSATFYHCNWISSSSVDCSAFHEDISCGTNLVTYRNKCEFSKAHCADDTINLMHYGACTNKPIVDPVAGSEVVFDFLCTSLSHTTCPTDISQVCGNDGRTYDNYCEYEKAKCTHRNLEITHLGACV